MLRDISYDHRAAQAALPVEVHYRNGTTVPALVVLDPAEMERWHMQLGRALDAREKAQGRP
ncbi:hypothetical protein ACH4SP_25905 [Streptomyces sp. NPDC021093]|uniref:hypothetical protein n=1 Tax=Streptomyces sp. NPDC021093 TaxID=3365112 RepID=UPI00379C4F07